MTFIDKIKELQKETKEKRNTILEVINNDYQYMTLFYQDRLQATRRHTLLQMEEQIEVLDTMIDMFDTDMEVNEKRLISLLLNDRTGEATRRLIKEHLGDYLELKVVLR